MEDARRRFTKEIAAWPDGTYESDAYVDADPLGQPGPPRALEDHGRRRAAEGGLRGVGQPPGDRRVVDLREHPRLHHRPAGAWWTRRSPRTRASSSASTCRCRSAAASTPSRASRSQPAPTIPGSRWATQSPRPCPRSSPTVAPPRPTSTAAPARCGGTSILGRASRSSTMAGRPTPGWVNAVKGVDGWGALAGVERQPDQGVGRDQRDPLPPHSPGPELHHRLRWRRASGGVGAGATSSRRCGRRPTSTSTSSTSTTPIPGSPGATTAVAGQLPPEGPGPRIRS